MISIISTRTYNIKSFLKDVTVFIVIVLVLYCVAALLQQRSLSSYSWYIPIFLFIVHIYDLLDRRRLLNIKFDDASRQIIIQYKTLLSKPDEKKIPFESARLEIVTRKSKPFPTAIYFLRGKTEVYETKSKEDLSQEQLIDIVEVATHFNIQIEKV